MSEKEILFETESETLFDEGEPRELSDEDDKTSLNTLATIIGCIWLGIIIFRLFDMLVLGRL